MVTMAFNVLYGSQMVKRGTYCYSTIDGCIVQLILKSMFDLFAVSVLNVTLGLTLLKCYFGFNTA